MTEAAFEEWADESRALAEEAAPAVAELFREAAAMDGDLTPDTPEQLAERAEWMPAMQSMQAWPT